MFTEIKRLLSITLLIFSGSLNAAVIFDNGTTIDPTNVTWNNTYPQHPIYDDFFLTSNVTLTDINYSIFANSSDNYVQTYVNILDGIGGSSVIGGQFTWSGAVSANGLTTTNTNVPNGFDVTLSGLNIDLSVGTYVLELITDTASGFAASIGSGDTGFGSTLYQLETLQQRPDHLAFSLEDNLSSVPEPATLSLLCLGIAGLIFSSKRKMA